MSTNQNMLKIGGIEAVVLYKAVKNLHLNVLPPAGKVRVTVPLKMKDDAVRTFLATRISWIKEQQLKFKDQTREMPREYISGETHYFFGNKYRLEVVYSNEKSGISFKGKSKIILTTKPNSSILKREKIMLNWYRAELRKFLDKSFVKWEQKIGVKAKKWDIRKMKTRWGSCNNKTKQIWLNLELVKKPENCINYVIVHELIHIIEDKHSDKFLSLLKKYFPKWKSTKEELNRFILSHEEWKE